MPAMTRHLNDCSSKTDGAHAPISHAFGERAVLKFVFAVLQGASLILAACCDHGRRAQASEASTSKPRFPLTNSLHFEGLTRLATDHWNAILS